MTDTKLDPRIEFILTDMPKHLSTQSVIDRGPEATWEYVCERLAQIERNSMMAALHRALKNILNGAAFVGVELEPGEYPGADMTVHINICRGSNPNEWTRAMISWDDMDSDWLVAQLYKFEDGDYLANVIEPATIQLTSDSTIGEFNTAAYKIYHGLHKTGAFGD